MTSIDQLAEEQTKEMVARQFDEFMQVFKHGDDAPKMVIERAKEELDIFKVARLYGHLHKLNRWEAKNNHVQIKCPFHDDNNPSCSLWRDINAFKCWSCGSRGDVVTFIQLLEGNDKVPLTLLKKMLTKEKLKKPL